MIAVAGGGTNAMDVSRNVWAWRLHGALRDFKLSAPSEGYFFSSRGLRQMFAKYYFNNSTHVTLPQSSRASCLGIVSLEAHS
jgi:hypothetical protein